MQHSVSAIAEQVAEMDGEVHARFVMTEVLSPTFHLIVVGPPAFWMIGLHRAKEWREWTEGAMSKSESIKAREKRTSRAS